MSAYRSRILYLVFINVMSVSFIQAHRKCTRKQQWRADMHPLNKIGYISTSKHKHTLRNIMFLLNAIRLHSQHHIMTQIPTNTFLPPSSAQQQMNKDTAQTHAATADNNNNTRKQQSSQKMQASETTIPENWRVWCWCKCHGRNQIVCPRTWRARADVCCWGLVDDTDTVRNKTDIKHQVDQDGTFLRV